MAEMNREDSIYNSIIIYCEEYAGKWQRLLQHPNIVRLKEQFASNPFLQVAATIVIASLLTPVLLFIVLAIVSAIFAFIGFMMVQVTVLAIGASILSCIFFCIASTFIMIGLCILTIYYALYYVSHAFDHLTLR
ncbi:PREDICTED: uncharacterized protein LOC106745838 [Dinoponera quadriceps]|uniref:Uncharacterized protein LOC106745838 n=1 Tax=Dinoponera quadriceps TaxID=609295 RepID=A0A6P3XGB2_DINQU|nr:PREDICTED: uncharacterized protein LOC106745838 [Dinoponera quadriceps]